MEQDKSKKENSNNEYGANLKKKKYIPPEIIFIPLKIEERLMACRKTDFDCADGEGGNNATS